MATQLYKEKQHFRDIPTFFVLGLILILTLYASWKMLTDVENQYWNLLISFAMVAVWAFCIWLLVRLTLKIVVTDKKIKYKMKPIQKKKKSISWDEIESYELVETPKAAQWCGANITFLDEKRISLNGRNGLFIETKDGKNYFIGFNDTEALKDCLEKINA